MSESSAISSSFQGTDVDSVAATVPPPSSAFDQCLHVIERTIDRLYRLSVAIRQPSIMGKNNKAERFPIIDDEGNIINDQFMDYARNIVAHSFPDITEELKDRLAGGIVSRRKRFLYRQSHQRKLRTRTVMSLNEQKGQALEIPVPKTDAASTVRGIRTLVESPVQEVGSSQRMLGAGVLPSQTSASGMDRTPIPIERVMDDEQSNQSTTFTNTHTIDGPVQVPKPPKPVSGSKEFECPYCCMMLPIKYAKAYKWRYLFSFRWRSSFSTDCKAGNM